MAKRNRNKQQNADRGRPPGAENREYLQADAVPSACPKCKSTERAEYRRKTVIVQTGRTPEGRPYNRIVLRPTNCLRCGQHRRDRSLEFWDDNQTQTQ